ncbi:MAG: molybdate ABC transporter permease subunit [Rickettsiales bacterium]|nr:molybdate ABC transporter permease subunit [Rickettsiales bacterium]
MFPLSLSLRTATLATLLVIPPGLLLAWLQARRPYPFRAVVDALVLLPLVLPPSVVGYLLVVLFGRRGPLGMWLESTLELRLIFSPGAVVLAAAVVALPLLVKTAQPALESVPLELEHVARTLGLGPWALFFRVTLPVAWPGIVAAIVLAFARALGEFGATLMFAGNIPGRTNTMPLEIFSAYQQGDGDRAALYVAILVLLSCAVVFVAARFSPGTRLR